MEHTLYRPLVPNEIRLLRIAKAHRMEEVVECEMKTEKLGKELKYRALSYTWGPREMYDITVEGQRVQVTRNLLDALKRLRREPIETPWQPPWEAEWLWIDALCINQEDLDERSSQVQMMGKIYRTAMEVVVCYDEPTHYRLECSGRRYKQLDEVAAGRDKSDALWSATYADFVDVFIQPWVLRAWIVQEAVFGTDPSILFAGETITFTRFTSVLRGFLEKTKADPWLGYLKDRISSSKQTDFVNAFTTLKTIQELQILLQSGRKRPLLWLLRRLRPCLATDPRDKIFSLLSLAADAAEYNKPDYSKPVEQIYLDFAIQCLRREPLHLSDLLAEAGLHNQSQMGASQLPSWVPEWSFNGAPRHHSFINSRASDLGDPVTELSTPSQAHNTVPFPEREHTKGGYADLREAHPDHRSEAFDLTTSSNVRAGDNGTAEFLKKMADDASKSLGVTVEISTKARMPEPPWVQRSLISDASDDLVKPRVPPHLRDNKTATGAYKIPEQGHGFNIRNHDHGAWLEVSGRIVDEIHALGPPQTGEDNDETSATRKWISTLIGADSWSIWQHQTWLAVRTWLGLSWYSWSVDTNRAYERMLRVCSADRITKAESHNLWSFVSGTAINATQALIEDLGGRLRTAPPMLSETILQKRPRSFAAPHAQLESTRVLKEITHDRAVCFTKHGNKLGLVLGCAKVGDLVARLDGVDGCLVLRRANVSRIHDAKGANHYVFVGDAFFENELEQGSKKLDHAEDIVDIVIT